MLSTPKIVVLLPTAKGTGLYLYINWLVQNNALGTLATLIGCRAIANLRILNAPKTEIAC